MYLAYGIVGWTYTNYHRLPKQINNCCCGVYQYPLTAARLLCLPRYIIDAVFIVNRKLCQCVYTPRICRMPHKLLFKRWTLLILLPDYFQRFTQGFHSYHSWHSHKVSILGPLVQSQLYYHYTIGVNYLIIKVTFVTFIITHEYMHRRFH